MEKRSKEHRNGNFEGPPSPPIASCFYWPHHHPYGYTYKLPLLSLLHSIPLPRKKKNSQKHNSFFHHLLSGKSFYLYFPFCFPLIYHVIFKVKLSLGFVSVSVDDRLIDWWFVYFYFLFFVYLYFFEFDDVWSAVLESEENRIRICDVFCWSDWYLAFGFCLFAVIHQILFKGFSILFRSFSRVWSVFSGWSDHFWSFTNELLLIIITFFQLWRRAVQINFALFSTPPTTTRSIFSRFFEKYFILFYFILIPLFSVM